MPLFERFTKKENRERAERIFELRGQGHSFGYIADELGINVSHAWLLYRRECEYRNSIYDYPFVEFIGSRTVSSIKKSLGEEILATPEKLQEVQNLKDLRHWPNVGPKIMRDLVEGLKEAGYEDIDMEYLTRILPNL